MKILCICDKPGWVLDRISHEIMERTDYEWSRVFFRNRTAGDISRQIEQADLTWVMNAGIEKYCDKDALLSKPLVYGFHSFKYDKESLAFATRTNAVIAPSIVLVRHLWSRGIDAQVVRNGVGDIFAPHSRIRVGFVGNDSGLKGHRIVQGACDEYGADLIQLGHDKVGDKDPEGSKYKIEPDFPYAEMPDWYASLDCLISMSEHEGFGMPILEAKAMNIPVISTYVGVAREVSGIHCERSVSAIVEKLDMLFGSRQVKDYTWDNSAKDFVRVVESIAL